MADESTDLQELRKQLADAEQSRRDLARELSAVKGDLKKLENSNRSLEEANDKTAKELAEARDHVKEANAEARERRLELRTVEKERDDVFALYGELETERDALNQQLASDPDGLRAQVGEYQQKLRNVAYDRAFEKVAKGLKVSDPVKYADLIALAKYEPAADDPDEASIAEKFAEVIKARSWLVDNEPALPAAPPAGSANGVHPSGTAPPAPHSLPPAPGSDRGGSSQTQQVERPSGRIAGRF